MPKSSGEPGAKLSASTNCLSLCTLWLPKLQVESETQGRGVKASCSTGWVFEPGGSEWRNSHWMLFRVQRPICHIRHTGLLFLCHAACEGSILLLPLVSKIVRMVKDAGLYQLRSSTAPNQIRKRCLLTLVEDRCRGTFRRWNLLSCMYKGTREFLRTVLTKIGWFGCADSLSFVTSDW
jgi:hypothetical protein